VRSVAWAFHNGGKFLVVGAVSATASRLMGDQNPEAPQVLPFQTFEPDHATAGRQVEDTHCSGHGEAQAPGNIDAVTVIDEQELSPYSNRKLDRSSFAIVQVHKGRVVSVATGRHDLDPQRWFRNPAAYTLRSLIVPQFVPHDLRHEYLLKEGRQNCDLFNQYEVIQRTGVGDNEPHWSSEAKTPKVIPVVLEVIERIRHVDIMGLEEHIQRLSRREPKQPTQFRPRETPQPELLDCERLQHSAWQIARSPKAGREIVRNANGHVHARILWGGALTVKKAQQVRLR